MAPLASETRAKAGVWERGRHQHGVITHKQLLECGLTRDAIKHRIAKRRLYRLHRGVYAVGRPELTRRGRWMAAVLSCGKGAVLSHESAASLWGIADRERMTVVSLPWPRQSARRDIRIHCPKFAPDDRTCLDAIPVTTVARTLIDLATLADPRRLEAAVNAADRLDLIHPEGLRSVIEKRSGQPGVPALRRLLTAGDFRLTDSELERRFLRLVRLAGLPLPETGVRIGSWKVDFFWRHLSLVVETDGLRYHRTSTQQARDRLRDQALVARGLTVLRFTHAQVADEPGVVGAALATVVGRLSLQAAEDSPRPRGRG